MTVNRVEITHKRELSGLELTAITSALRDRPFITGRETPVVLTFGTLNDAPFVEISRGAEIALIEFTDEHELENPVKA